MLSNKRITIVVPAFNEEKLIEKVLNQMPDFVDEVIVVDDASCDRTVQFVENYQSNSFKLILVKHAKNRGVGAAICTGYKKAIEVESDVAVVMAGDAQMDPNDLKVLVEPVVNGEVEYAKGNRLLTGQAWQLIPKVRYLGNAVLSMLTKITSGYWHISDSQTGYTAISIECLKKLDLDRVYSRYGMPNDFLVRLNVVNARVRDVPVNPVYNIGEKSGIRIGRVVFSISFLLLKMFIWRMKEKYIIRDFHPLVFFYLFGTLFTACGIGLGCVEVYMKMATQMVPLASVVLVALLVISGFQFLCFAMWLDMQTNQHLR